LSEVRQHKIESSIRRIVAEYFQRELNDPRADGLISITKVEITPDLSLARVYVSIFGNKTPTKTVFHGIESATRRSQGAVAKGLPIRTAPKLEFRLDDSLKKEAEVLKTIDQAMKDTPGTKPASDTKE
jgi:ribosome-binding factor A